MNVDRVCVINLDRRPDRIAAFYRDYPHDLPPAERVSATDYLTSNPPDGLKDLPAWGCWDSHRRIITESVGMGADSVLIFEDDAFPRSEFSSRWQLLSDHLPADWQFVFLGGAPRGFIPYQRINEQVMVPLDVRTTHAYAVRQPFLGMLAKALQPPRTTDHIDVYYGTTLTSLCPTGFYCPIRWLFGQRAGRSDIAGVMMDDREFRDPLDISPVRFVPRPQKCDQDQTGRCRRKRCGLTNSSVCRIGNGLMEIV